MLGWRLVRGCTRSLRSPPSHFAFTFTFEFVLPFTLPFTFPVVSGSSVVRVAPLATRRSRLGGWTRGSVTVRHDGRTTIVGMRWRRGSARRWCSGKSGTGMSPISLSFSFSFSFPLPLLSFAFPLPIALSACSVSFAVVHHVSGIGCFS